MMKKAVVYIHGKGGSAAGAGHFEPLFPDFDVIGFDYRAGTPWEAKDEFTAYFAEIGRQYASVVLIADSIGAFFAMNADVGGKVERAYFISPVVDMPRLIADMMTWAGVTGDELRRRGEIPTAFGETLSWAYLCYVRNNPIRWGVPTRILYGERDDLTSLKTVTAFAEGIGAALTVMPGGEHWFHTAEQMSFLDEWVKMQ